MTRGRVVVVGAGVSGLAVGCLLARSGREVVVLEQHTIPGGLMQRFTRRGLAFDTGLHYLGGAGEGGPLRRYLAHLGVLERIELEPFDPDGVDEVVLPERRVVLPQGSARAEAHLACEFPSDAVGIARWFRAQQEVADRHPLFSFPSTDTVTLPPLDRDPPSVAERLRELIADPDLRATLAARCALYGVSGDDACFDVHALVASSFRHSAHGLRGGGTALVRALVENLAAAGGQLRLRADVARICTAGRRVVGVETAAGEHLACDAVVSSAHPATTLALLPPDVVPGRVVRALDEIPDSHAALLVHCLARGAAPTGLRRNRFAFRSALSALRPVLPWFAAGGLPDRMVVLAAPANERAPGDTLFQAFVPLPVGDEPDLPDRDAWNAHKAAAAARIVPWVEDVVPAWRGRVEVIDVSTPRAVARYVRSRGGSCFGLANVAGRSGRRKLAPNLGLQGLLTTGQSAGLPGILGSLVSAYVTAGSLEGGPGHFYTELLASG